MVLSGLNEGTWPPAPAPDPWMSRPMRKRFGLPSLERPPVCRHMTLRRAFARTKSSRAPFGSTARQPFPRVGCNAWTRCFRACGLSPDVFKGGDLLAQARLLDHAKEYRPAIRLRPKPPAAARPRKLSVTQIDTWMKDPYSIYAKNVLKLEPLRPLEQELDAALRGTLVLCLTSS